MPENRNEAKPERNKMIVTVNGNNENLRQGITIEDFLKEKNLDPDSVVVEHNRGIAGKDDYASIVLNDNDTLEVLRFVGGG